MQLTIAQAEPTQLETVLSLLDEAAAWLQRQGIAQWPATFSGEENWRTPRIRAYLEAGQTWLVEAGDEAVAVFTLAGADPHFAHGWPDSPETGLYVYRMAVRRAWSGRGIGQRILDWAASRADQLGKKWLRLDCHRENAALQRYYEQLGFERVGTVVTTIDPVTEVAGGSYTRGSGALFQRAVNTIVLADSERYDPHGEAKIWEAAANIVASDKTSEPPNVVDLWNTALDGAAIKLDNKARAVRQGHGMYYRVIST